MVRSPIHPLGSIASIGKHCFRWSAIALVLLGMGSGLAAASNAKPQSDTRTTTNPSHSVLLAQGQPILQLGNRGQPVSELQSTLKRLGYYTGAVDGIYGQTTAQAVARFQQAAGLRADGITGSDTWNRLYLTVRSLPTAPPASEPLIRRPVLQPGSEGSEVSELQAAIKLLGYYSGPVDGRYGQTTEAAVARFQQDAGLKVDGITGPATWDRLFPPTPAPPRATPTATAPTCNCPPAPSPSDNTANNTTPSPPNPTPTTNVTLPILRPGMRGPAIINLQERLRAIGVLKGVVDGVFGPATETAVKAVQRNSSLNPDGIVGPATWNALLR